MNRKILFLIPLFLIMFLSPISLQASNETVLASNPTPNIPFQAQNNTGMQIIAGEQYQIQTQSHIQLTLQLSEQAQVNITEYDKPIRQYNQDRLRLRTKTFSVECNNTQAGIQAQFAYNFAILNESAKNILRFMYYDEVGDTWMAPKTQWFEGNTLYCDTTHFSLWAVMESLTGDFSNVTALPESAILLLIGLPLIVGTILVISKRKR